MASLPLCRLHQRTVRIDFAAPSFARHAYGVASYEEDADLGSILRIDIGDAGAPVDILLQESSWTGQINFSDTRDYEFRVLLGDAGAAPMQGTHIS
jgi:hypothetical protein